MSYKHAAIFTATLLLFTATLSAGPVNKSYFGGLAVDGYGVVAYFTDGKAIKGNENDAQYAKQ